LDNFEKAYLGFATFLLGVTLFGLLLAELGLFNAFLAGAGGLAFLGVFLYATRRAVGITTYSSWAAVLFAVGLLCYGVLVLLPPFNMILGGVDPGVYVNTAAHIRATGAILIHDPVALAAARVPAISQTFLPWPRQYLPGFYLLQDVIIPQFYHAYPVFLAFVGSFVGFTGAMYAMPFLALLNAVGMFLLARRWLNATTAAVLAVALLASNVSFVWFSSYANSEMLALQFFLSGLLALLLGEESDSPAASRGWAVLSAALWGAAFLTRMTMVFLFPPAILGWLIFIWRGKTRLALAWISTLAAFVLWTGVHVYFFSFPYFNDVFYKKAARPLLRQHSVLLVFTGLLATTLTLALTLALRPASSARHAVGEWIQRGKSQLFPGSVILLLGLSGCYYVLHWEVLKWVAWYCGVPALALSFVGTILFAKGAAHGSHVSVSLAIFLTVGFLTLIVLGPNPHVDIRHFWASRRLLVFVFPLVALLAARGLVEVMRQTGRLSGYALFLVALMPGAYNITPLIQFEMYKNVPHDLKRLARHIPPDSLVLCGPTGEWKTATPLRFLYGVHTFGFMQPTLTSKSLDSLTKTFPRGEIFLLSIAPTYPRIEPPYTIRGDLIIGIPIKWREFDEPEDQLPRTYHLLEGNLELWRIYREKTAASLSFHSKAARLEDHGVDVQGLFASEPGKSFRWTDGHAVLSVPLKLLRGNSILYLELNDDRPQPAETDILLNSQRIGSVEVQRGQVSIFSYRLPSNWPAESKDVKLEIDTPAWVPAKAYGTQDNRELGVMLLELDIEK
jgi:4-amino-4-deoxy-L-arabinose transferase-like glycosyltransferase